MKFFYKLLLVFLAIAVLPALGIAYFSYHSGRTTIERDIYNLLQTTNVHKNDQFNQWLANNQQMLLQISTTPDVIDKISVMTRVDPDGMVFEAYRNTLLLEHLTPLLANQTGFVDYIVIGVPDGLILASTNPILEGKYRESEAYFLEGQKGPYIDQVRFFISEQEIGLHISTPIRDHSGKLLAVLVGHASPAEMARIMQLKTDLARTQETYLVNKSNFFVTEPELGDAFALRKTIRTEGVNRCLEGYSDFGAYKDYRGVEVIGYYHWISDRQMCILTEIDQAEAFAPIYALQNQIVLFGLATVALVTLLAAGFSNTLTRPLEKLVNGTREIGKGNLDYRITANTGDEVEQLARAFNEMSAHLQQNINQVQHNQRQVLALSQAAQVVQRALSPNQIYQAVGAEVGKLGYQVAVLQLKSRNQFTIPYLSLGAESLMQIEKLTGAKVLDYCGKIPPEGLLDQVIKSGESRFFSSTSSILAEIFPALAQTSIDELSNVLKANSVILTPLLVNKATWGFMIIGGQELRKSDIPAIEVFANQAAVALENVFLLNNLQTERNFTNALLETSSALTFVLDETGRLVRFNHGCQATTGYTFEELRGRTIWEVLFLPGDTEWVRSRFEALLQGGANSHYECAWRAKDGSLRWIIWSYAALRDEQNQAQFVVQTGIDITDRKILEQELREARDELEIRVQERTASLQESEERYRTLSEAAPDMIFTVDPEYRVRYANSHAALQFGLEPQRLAGQFLDQFFSSDVADRLRQAIHRVFTSGEKVFSENRVQFQGEDLWLSTWLVPLRDPTGTVHTVMGVSRDITLRKMTEQQLQSTVLQLGKSNQELEQFAYVASHDLQEPLRMVTSYLQLIERRYRDRLDEDADVYINYAVDGANRMKTLINDLLAYSRVGTRGKEFAPADLSKILNGVLGEYGLMIEETGARITSDPLPVLVVDESQIAQLFRNLLGNAFKFHGDQPPRIHIGAADQGGTWLFSVRDEGIGMDPKYFDRIFVIFQRLHTHEEYPGTGIGLAICKKIVERHKGKIWVESQPGQGATFFFTLPKVI